MRKLLAILLLFAAPAFGQGVGHNHLLCTKTESLAGTGSYQTLVNVSDGPGVVTNLWFAFSTTVTNAQTDKVKITFDGAGSPQIICTQADFCGTGYIDSCHFRHSHAGGTCALDSGSGSVSMSGFIKLPMPYSSSCKVECNQTGGSMFCMCERYRVANTEAFKEYGLPLKSMRLFTTGDGSTTTPASGAATTLLDTNVPTLLAGVVHFMSNDTTPGYLEGNYKIYYGGSGTASYESSGTEDFYHSSFYFAEGPFGDDDEALPFNNADQNSTASRTTANRFWPLTRAPYDADGVKLTWTNGDGAGPGGTTTTRWLVWYYK